MSFVKISICQALIDRFPRLWVALEDQLSQLNVGCVTIPGENPWIRDYMPVSIPDLGLFQFRYAPSYHKDSRYCETEEVFVPEHLSRESTKMDWVMDGGGVLADDQVVLLSAAFPPPEASMLDCFLGKTVLTIPVSENDFTGHLDGLCRLHGRKFLFHDYAWDDIPEWEKVCGLMAELGYEPVEIPCALIEERYDSAQGVYLNYVVVGDCALVPVSSEVNSTQQQRALAALCEALNMELIQVPADECAREGGA